MLIHMNIYLVIFIYRTKRIISRYIVYNIYYIYIYIYIYSMYTIQIADVLIEPSISHKLVHMYKFSTRKL